MGAGVAGSAAALELARRGRRVALVERFQPGHARGSSHGPTRVFRISYRDPMYVRLALESVPDWQRLERDAGEQLLTHTGGIDLGPGADDCALALDTVGVEYELLDRAGLQNAGIKMEVNGTALFQKEAAVIAAERTVLLQAELAVRAGVAPYFGSTVRAVTQSADSVTISTDGDSIECERAVIAAGAWTSQLTRESGIEMPPLEVTCEQVSYLRSADAPESIVIDWTEPARYMLPVAYSSPGVKSGFYRAGPVVDPNDGPFEPSEELTDGSKQWYDSLTNSDAEVLLSETCLYTNAPRDDFVLKQQGNVIILSACSGHGFKFGPRMGRAAADVAEGKDPRLPERIFRS
ncbi:MAG TPA: FAD-dependent oxidoreductase [Actinomycetota bacterium]|nr:FAD-dependent oxidoreductase [Actinomycetota bacterium]